MHDLDWLSHYLARWDTYTSTVGDVIRVMEKIQESDEEKSGFGAFNWLYLTVTRAVEQYIQEERHLSDDWLANLDIAFAKLYIQAIVWWNNPHDRWRTPRAWAALFQAHETAGRRMHIRPLQFAVAGLNAHISVDLPVAVAQVSRDPEVFRWRSDERKDFLRINDILNMVEVHAMRELSGKKFRDLCTVLPVDTYVIMMITRMRNNAWNNAKRIARKPRETLDIVTTLDREAKERNEKILSTMTGLIPW